MFIRGKAVIVVLLALAAMLTVIPLVPSIIPSKVVHADNPPYYAGSYNKRIDNWGGMVDITYANPVVVWVASSEWVMSNMGAGSGKWVQAGWQEYAGWSGPKKWVQFAGPLVPGGYQNWYGSTVTSGVTQHAEVWFDGTPNPPNPDLWKGKVCDAGAGNCFTVSRNWQDLGFFQGSYFQIAGESHDSDQDDIGGFGEQNAVQLKWAYYWKNESQQNPANPNFTYFSSFWIYHWGYISGLPTSNNVKNWTYY
jgi:hypothetical protein